MINDHGKKTSAWCLGVEQSSSVPRHRIAGQKGWENLPYGNNQGQYRFAGSVYMYHITNAVYISPYLNIPNIIYKYLKHSYIIKVTFCE